MHGDRRNLKSICEAVRTAIGFHAMPGRFYESLSDEQKARFNQLGVREASR